MTTKDQDLECYGRNLEASDRASMLSAIEHKIARTGGGTGSGETGYYLPIEGIDIRNYLLKKELSDSEHMEIMEQIRCLWDIDNNNLEKQSTDCITYIFNLISHDK